MSGSNCSSPSATVHLLTGLLTLSYPSASWFFNQSWSEVLKVSASNTEPRHMHCPPSCACHSFWTKSKTLVPLQRVQVKASGGIPGLGRYAVISLSGHMTVFLGSDFTPWPREVTGAGFASPWSSDRCFRIDLGFTPSRAPLSGSSLTLTRFRLAADLRFCCVLPAPLSPYTAA